MVSAAGCAYKCVYIDIHIMCIRITHMYTYISVYTCRYTHTHTHTRTYDYTNTNVYKYIYTCHIRPLLPLQ